MNIKWAVRDKKKPGRKNTHVGHNPNQPTPPKKYSKKYYQKNDR